MLPHHASIGQSPDFSLAPDDATNLAALRLWQTSPRSGRRSNPEALWRECLRQAIEGTSNDDPSDVIVTDAPIAAPVPPLGFFSVDAGVMEGAL